MLVIVIATLVAASTGDVKFLYCARHIMTPDHIQGTIEQIRDLENIQNASGLASILGA